jgi:hypothetical protein
VSNVDSSAPKQDRLGLCNCFTGAFQSHVGFCSWRSKLMSRTPPAAATHPSPAVLNTDASPLPPSNAASRPVSSFRFCCCRMNDIHVTLFISQSDTSFVTPSILYQYPAECTATLSQVTVELPTECSAFGLKCMAILDV